MYKKLDEKDRSIENILLCLKVVESPNKCMAAIDRRDYNSVALNRGGCGNTPEIWEKGDYIYRVVPTKTRRLYDPNCDCCSCESNFDSAHERFHEVIEVVNDPDDDHDEWRVLITEKNDKKYKEWGPIKDSEDKADMYLWDNYVVDYEDDDYIWKRVAEIDGVCYSFRHAETILFFSSVHNRENHAKAIENYKKQNEGEQK